MGVRVTPGRQRVPMLTASVLEDRTRPALDGSAASRLRYFRWSTWTGDDDRAPAPGRRPTPVRLGHRLRRTPRS